jgi:hypothetical protein
MMQDGQNAECPMVQEFWQDLQGLFAPFTLIFAWNHPTTIQIINV